MHSNLALFTLLNRNVFFFFFFPKLKDEEAIQEILGKDSRINCFSRNAQYMFQDFC